MRDSRGVVLDRPNGGSSFFILATSGSSGAARVVVACTIGILANFTQDYVFGPSVKVDVDPRTLSPMK